MGRRADRAARPDRVATGASGHRPQGTHPGAQLRIIDAHGLRVTAFAPNTRRGHHAAVKDSG